MPVSPNAVVHQAIVQVVYGEGIVYLDHCGSLTRDLQRLFGKGFRFGIPTIQQGFGRSEMERLTVTYGPDALGIVQDGVHEVARFAQVANWAWRSVAHHLDVGKKVARCGIRFIQLFGAQSNDDAEEALVKSGLVKETDGWSDLLGACKKRSFVGVSEPPDWSALRCELAGKSIELIDEPPADMKPFLPPYSVSLDTDFIMKIGVQSALSYEDLMDGIVRAWTKAKELGEQVGERLSNA